MGMAASQARYLCLTARKSNVEYEGQQVNQQRTELANESAGIFNQLLTLNVPTPPSSSDYTTIQNTFNDGIYDETITNKSPLPTTDPEYGTYNYNVTYTHTASTYTGVQAKNADPKNVGTQLTTYNGTTGTNPTAAYTDYLDKQNATTANTWTKVGNNGGNLTTYVPDNSTMDAEVAQIAASNPTSNFALAYNADKAKVPVVPANYNDISYYTSGTGTSVVRHYTCNTDLKASVDTNVGSNQSTIPTCWTPVVGGITTGTGGTTGNTYTLGVFDNVNLYATATNGTNPANYTSSNGKVFALATDAQADSQGLPPPSGATAIDTLTSVATPLMQSDTSTTGVTQTTLNTYYATYLDKPVTTTEKAFLDTDASTSRIDSIRLKSSPDTTFTVKSETKQDDAAYQDAMNQYTYKNTLYQQQVTDVNAKTSVLQQEDRTLELRLRQLDTEQEALQTEMESVKKVIDKNIESTFKTFQ